MSILSGVGMRRALILAVLLGCVDVYRATIIHSFIGNSSAFATQFLLSSTGSHAHPLSTPKISKIAVQTAYLT